MTFLSMKKKALLKLHPNQFYAINSDVVQNYSLTESMIAFKSNVSPV